MSILFPKFPYYNPFLFQRVISRRTIAALILLLTLPVLEQAQHEVAIEQSIDSLWHALGSQDKNAFVRHIANDWYLYSACGNKLDVNALFSSHTAKIKYFNLEKSIVDIHRADDMRG